MEGTPSTRSMSQDDAKQATLDKLNGGSCLIVIDWAMKFVLHHYREQISESTSAVEVGTLVL